jgi:RNA polymerase sigma-70 factor (ECF subfamily)
LNLQKRRRPQQEIDEQLISNELSPDDRCHQNEVTEIVRSALMELPVDYRQVVVLRHLLNLSHRDISEALGVPEKTVKSRLYTGRQKLGDILERRGIGRT